ncbi:MAG: DHH family phosphoesterase [Anaerolineales bacterium]
MTDPVQAAAERIHQAERIAVVSHERPDGDAVGSLLAVYEALTSAGKIVTPVLVSGVPGRFSFLPGAAKVEKSFPQDCDLLMAVDCGAADRFGIPVDSLPRSVDINVDHHPTNTQFAAMNIVWPEAAATTEMLHKLLPAWKFPISEAIATNLLTGLLTDTIGFRTSSTTSETLRIAADLTEIAVPLSEIYDKAILRMSFVAANYWGYGLSRLEREDDLVWTSLKITDRKQVGYPGADDADLVNLLMTIDEARVVVLFVEQSADKVKVSWRAQPGVDVSKVASVFGGGGHKPAAGAMIEDSLGSVQERVLKATREAM